MQNANVGLLVKNYECQDCTSRAFKCRVLPRVGSCATLQVVHPGSQSWVSSLEHNEKLRSTQEEKPQNSHTENRGNVTVRV